MQFSLDIYLTRLNFTTSLSVPLAPGLAHRLLQFAFQSVLVTIVFNHLCEAFVKFSDSFLGGNEETGASFPLQSNVLTGRVTHLNPLLIFNQNTLDQQKKLVHFILAVCGGWPQLQQVLLVLVIGIFSQELLQICNETLWNYLLVHHSVVQFVRYLVLDVEELQSTLQSLRLGVGPNNCRNHWFIRLFEVNLLVLMIHNVDIGWVNFKIWVRMVPPDDFQSSLLNQFVRFHCRLRTHFSIVIPLFLRDRFARIRFLDNQNYQHWLSISTDTSDKNVGLTLLIVFCDILNPR